MGLVETFRSVLGIGLEAEIDRKILTERAHRIALARLQDLHCQVTSSVSTTTAPADVRVHNISQSGVAFLSVGFPDCQPRQIFSARFRSGADEFVTEIEVIRRNEATVGARILADEGRWKNFLRQHFMLEMSAGALHLVDSSLLAADVGGEVWWYFSPGGRELYFVVEAEQVREFQLVFDGHHFSFDGKKLSYGRLGTEAKDDDVGLKESALVQPSSQVPRDLARRFVSNIERLPTPFLQQILRAF